MHTQYRPLRLNVGFLLSQSAGYGRQLDFQEEKLNLGEDLQVADFSGRVQLNRTPQGIVAKGVFNAELHTECARCLKPFATPVSIQLEDLFVFPPQNATDPLLVVGDDAHLNLEPLLREYILINQPTRPLCRPDCKGLCPICGNDLNDGECLHPEEEGLGLVPERMLIRAKEKQVKPLPAKKKAKPPSAVKSKPTATGKKTTTAKKQPSKKKPAAKATRKKATGGKKTAGKKRTGTKKKTSTKK